jgi:hypothetical protein
MSDRKQTPDVLGDLLSAGSATDDAPAPLAPVPAQPRASRQRAKPKAAPAAAPAAAQVPAALSVPPPRWEYREVTFREFRGWRPRFVDGRERWDWKEAPTMLDYLRQAGDEGWELVSVGAEHHYQKTAYLKRPKVG